ncbi:MAG: hypothetical protein IRY99_16230 [Isosphaeraceae bacterium]|nr:hypothetical protein [Isosphaeraceae bacterium]
MEATAYPWYGIVHRLEIAQGDILEGCPVFLPPDDWDLDEGATASVMFRWEERDVIVMTQSCDLVLGREKVSEVLLCPIWGRSELTTGHLATPKGLEDARRGNLPGVHLIATSELEGFHREVRIVDFRRVHALPLSFIRRRAERTGDRLRLLPPYREHLSQAFARYFMRVGLPVDIPPFR